MCFRARQNLIDRKQPVESRTRDPAFVLNELAPEHGDLGDRTAPSQETESQKLEENLWVRQIRNGRLTAVLKEIIPGDSCIHPHRSPCFVLQAFIASHP